MLDPLADLAAALADRYTIERELGRGGHAIVYLARDRKHNRQVAIKVLLSELSLSVSVERFRREIELASQLTHPHILGLIDSGEAAGCLYYVMPYVAGETLRDRLRREKQLALEESLRIAREVAEALGHAHRQGVVHRDIKPENILLADGHALVADFGIARALAMSGAGTITQTGVVVGTPQYMSPEQAGGAADVDGRSDIYSLACVLYEMLSGHAPYAGGSPQELVARHALDPVPSLRAARPDVSEGIERCVAKALAKVPVARFATATDFIASLDAGGAETPPRRRKGLFITTAVAVVAVGGALIARSALTGPSVQPSVAVLPFINMSGDPENDYLGDGVSEELINALVQVPGLRVPARTSSFFFKGKDLSLRQIGESLKVTTVLEGSIRKAGNALRITAQLITVADGYHLWSQTYNRALVDSQNVLAVQEEIARAIVQALQGQLGSSASTTLARQPTRDPAAYDLYLRGRYFENKGTEDGLYKAVEHYEAAIAQDSGFALAYAQLSRVHWLLLSLRYAPREYAIPLARAAALQAIALDSTSAEAHSALGRVLDANWEWDDAEREYARSIALNPNSAYVRANHARFLALRSGRLEEGIRESERAFELDPLSSSTAALVARAYQRVGDYDRTIAEARKALDLEPNSINARQYLAEAYYFKGMSREAITEFQTLLQQLGNRGRAMPVLARLGYAHARTGDRAAALRTLAQMQARRQDLGYALSVALLHTGLGDVERAFQALEQAFAERDFSMPTTLWLPYWDPLRKDPRFARLLERLGLDR